MSSKAVQTPRLIGEQSCDLAGGFGWIYLTPHDVIARNSIMTLPARTLSLFHLDSSRYVHAVLVNLNLKVCSGWVE